MREDPPRKFETEELVKRYFNENSKLSGQDEAHRPGIFAREKVFRNILSVIGRRRSAAWRMPAKRRFSAKRRLPVQWQIAASIGVLLCLFALVYQFNDAIRDFLQPDRMLIARTERGEIKVVTLDDGTKIWLNAASRLTYPASFAGDKREISLEGEAYFDVAHDASRPFVVHADRVTTRVLGTRFNISAYRDEDNITVSVVQGKVGVSTGRDATSDQPDLRDLMLVLPKQHIVYHKSSRLLSRGEDDDSGSPASWKEGMLVYRDASLAEIVADLQRAHNVKIETGKKVEGCKISADFNNDSLTKVLRILAELVNGELAGEDGKYLLTGEGCGQ